MVRVSGGHLCIYAQAPTEPTGETLPYNVFMKRFRRGWCFASRHF